LLNVPLACGFLFFRKLSGTSAQFVFTDFPGRNMRKFID
jgi:hypothetical protein